ncbi:acyl-CoA-like ligand-binding transcription factor [Nocardia jiangxiensis]|uniref:acyl-CoA-like ligand-binding transcription factor n=1 Tax=Nocardia jiangxiensis TaxID=282685 RepID=UPI000593A9F9|nr:TetR family transcriptional regulator [Nocardia jiangxiensis]
MSSKGAPGPAETVDRGGRPPSTSARELAEIALELFLRKGFEATSVDEIAAVAGVSRRTFFRYFSTKADTLWVESAAEVQRFRELLAAAPPDEPYDEVLCRVAPQALDYRPGSSWALHRATLTLTVPEVQEKATSRHAAWRNAATEFVADRRGGKDLIAIAVGQAVHGATVGAHEYWVNHPDEDVLKIMTEMLRLLIPHPTD